MSLVLGGQWHPVHGVLLVVESLLLKPMTLVVFVFGMLERKILSVTGLKSILKVLVQLFVYDLEPRAKGERRVQATIPVASFMLLLETLRGRSWNEKLVECGWRVYTFRTTYIHMPALRMITITK